MPSSLAGVPSWRNRIDLVLTKRKAAARHSTLSITEGGLLTAGTCGHANNAAALE